MADGQPLTHLQLRVGHELVIYSRRFMITGCDQATRAFYSELGIPQQSNFATPEGQYDATVKVGLLAAADVAELYFDGN